MGHFVYRKVGSSIKIVLTFRYKIWSKGESRDGQEFLAELVVISHYLHFISNILQSLVKVHQS